MGKPLRVLIVEDSERDTTLVLQELRRGGYEPAFERVDTAEGLRAALEKQSWDVVISDYSMPAFSAPAALAVVMQCGLDLPLIVVSGTIGEEEVVEAMRAGACDFLNKGKFARLIPAIERELREALHRAERKKMQEQLLISDRMASVGTLAAGVAHEINNPMAALMANLDFATDDVARLALDIRSRDDLRDGVAGWLSARLTEIAEPLCDARDSARRVRSIVRDLKVFSRPEEQQREAVDIRRVIESTLRMTWIEIRHRARLVKDFGQTPLVYASDSRLGQVFLNLIVNAAQAIPEGHADENEIRVITRTAPGGRVMIQVRDTGAGIPENIVARIFEPFFTTKPVGGGTGLGLAISHRIIAEMGGEMTVDSEVGKGATFTVLLPAATDEEETAVATPRAPKPEARGKEGRVLVVDDEAMLGKAIKRMLGSEQDVEVLTSGRNAVHRISVGERYDVILCDLMMPDLTGMQVYAELKRTAPDQAERMVFMTGGVFTRQAREFLAGIPNARVEKPFETQMLRALIRNLVK